MTTTQRGRLEFLSVHPVVAHLASGRAEALGPGSQGDQGGSIWSLLIGLKGGAMTLGGDTAGGTGASPIRTDGREALRTLSDKPLTDDADDRLGFAGYADALAELLDHPDTDTPLTIAISAQWGAGKTSLAKMVESRLKQRPVERGDPPHITCWFNAWMHDDAPHLGAAFAAEVAKQADRYRPMWRRLISPLPSAMLSPEERWRRRLAFAMMSIIVAVAIALLPGTGRVLRQVFAPKAEIADRLQELFGSAAGAAILVFVAFAASRRFYAIAQAAARFVDDPRSEAAKGAMQEVSTQLGQLITQATHARQWLVLPRPERRLVIFVDDLERCRPPRAVEVCEVASHLLGHPNVVTVLIADMATIATSAEIKYADLEQVRASAAEGSTERSPIGTYGRLYLQKIVQIQFNLPSSPAESMPGLLRETVRDTVRPSTAKAPPAPRSSLILAGLIIPVRSLWTSIGIIGCIGILFYWIRGTSSFLSSTLLAWVMIYAIMLLAGILALIQNLVEDYRSYRTKQAQRQIDHDIRQVVNAGAATVEEVIGALVGKSLEPQRRELARQRAQRILADESPHRTEAESEIKEYLPALPRSAKRLFNHLRVLLVIAEQKQMFGGQPELQAKHLARWAVLLERWPEVASALTANPGRLAELEAATDIEELSTLLGAALPASLASQDLLGFLNTAELAPVAGRLVHFQPAKSDEGAEARSDGRFKAAAPISPASRS
jgi:hypothetical protein